MKVSCPHCSQRILLDTDSLASLHGSSGFDCPHCGGWIPFPPVGTPSSPPPGEHRSRGWAAPEADELAKSFDSRYQIRRLLGRGGMGAVYEGFDTRLDRRVAIKILPRKPVRIPTRSPASNARPRPWPPSTTRTSSTSMTTAKPPKAIPTSSWSSSTAWTSIISATAASSTCPARWNSFPKSAPPCNTPISRHHPPRHQARQHPRLQRGRRQSRGFRPRQGARHRHPRAARTHAHPVRHRHGHARLHGSRADGGTTRRSPRRHLLARHHALRPAHRQPAARGLATAQPAGPDRRPPRRNRAARPATQSLRPLPGRRRGPRRHRLGEILHRRRPAPARHPSRAAALPALRLLRVHAAIRLRSWRKPDIPCQSRRPCRLRPQSQ